MNRHYERENGSVRCLRVGSALSKEVKGDHDEADDQNDVDQAAQDFFENDKAEQPDNDQNYSDGEEHSSTLRKENSTKTVTYMIAKIALIYS